MKIALLGKPFDDEAAPFVQALLDDLAARHAEIHIGETFRTYLDNRLHLPPGTTSFRRGDSLRGTQFVFSLGGDGTLLDTVTYVGNLQIPILGIHTGRLGFLATITPDMAAHAIDAIYKAISSSKSAASFASIPTRTSSVASALGSTNSAF